MMTLLVNSCSDIDECSTDNGGCEQECTNPTGSFFCSCNEGFTLNADGMSCDGKLEKV